MYFLSDVNFSTTVKTYNRKGKLVKSHNRKTLTEEQKKRNRVNRQLLGLGMLGVTTGALIYPSLTHTKRAKKIAEIFDKIDRKRMDDYGMPRNKTQDEILLEQSINDRTTGAGNKPSMILDDPIFDKTISNKGRLQPRLKNLNRIIKGGVSDKFPGLATDLHVIKNYKKYNLSKLEKSKLIKEVAKKLKVLKVAGKFKTKNNTIKFIN